ncbi:MAG: sensor histidine kinase, partial [Nocardioidaceae bacterium]
HRVKSRHDSATRFVIAIVVIGLVAFVAVVLSGVAVVRRLGETQAIEQARSLTQAEARFVEFVLEDGFLTGDALSRRPVAEAIFQVVRKDRSVQRVKIWSPEGEILYSDEDAYIGKTYPLGEDELEVLEHGNVEAEMSEKLTGEENRYDEDLGPVTEVYTRIMTPDRKPLLFETYRSSAQIASSGRDIAATFTPVLVLTLVVVALLEVSLAAMLIRRIRRGQRERERLMEEAMEASFRERRRIAGDLHDGPVQEMAGLSLGLAAQAEAAEGPARASLLQAAGAVRSSVRALRSAIVGVYPPNLERTGLEVALSDLLSRLPNQQINTHLAYDLDSDLSRRSSELLFRTGQEAIRNVEKHANASNVWVTVARDNGQVRLSVHDDGGGGAAVNDQVSDSGRFGLAVLADIVNDAGGQMRLTSDDAGTTVQVEVPS